MTLLGRRRSSRRREIRVPGEEGIWILVLGDMSVFALFFGTFMYSRARNPELFGTGHAELSMLLGTTNTVLLLTSSLLVALGVDRGQRRAEGAGRLFCGALACGLGFVAIKALEWSHLFAAGVAVGTSEYFSYYFMFTGIHLAHVVIGLTILGRLIGLSRSSQLTEKQHQFFETGAIFWHMVDLLWVVLFALFYLVR